MRGLETQPNPEVTIQRRAELGADIQPELLVPIQALYDRGLCRQAYELARSIGPMDKWRGLDACILAGRLALNLGAPRLAFRHHTRAFNISPGSIRAQAYYLEAFLGARGPVLAWERFRQFESELQSSEADGQPAEGWEYLFTLGARICGLLRDFERAEEQLKLAQRDKVTPWILVEQSMIFGLRERWEESLQSARRALEIQPWYRPAVQQSAHCLHTLGRDDEALQFLKEATTQIESLPVLIQLAGLQVDLEQFAAALATLEQAANFSQIAEKAVQLWIDAQGCRAACALGDMAQAELFAKQLDDDYHRGLAGRLRSASNHRRVRLQIPFIQQYRLSCVPATLTMLCRFWGFPAEQVEVAEAICYDGTPSHRARRWAEANGFFTREFTMNWEVAKTLLDREIPFAVYTAEATSAHVQVIVGYDELRRTLIVRNPSFPQIQELNAEPFLEHYRAAGPASLVVLPPQMKGLLSSLSLPDTDLYDRLRRTQQALEDHRRNDAEQEFLQLLTLAPGHWLTLTTGRALYSYDTNTPALLDCLAQLLALFPHDGNLSLAKLGIMREIGRREDRLEFLRGICSSKNADPVFHQQLAQELLADARQYPAATRALKKAMRLQPLNALTIAALGNLYWTQRRFAAALDTYRFAACLEETKEPPAITYFAAANARRQTETALEFLQARWKRNRTKSPGPFITWFNALLQTGQTQQALDQLEQELRLQPGQGELWLLAADTFARYGRLERAQECIKAANGKVQTTASLRVQADLARYRTDSKTALSLWREVLQFEPLSIQVHRSLVWVIAESEGSDAALRHLEDICSRFPHHYQLHQLWSEWARGAGPEAGERAARRLMTSHPADAWARRQLALTLCDAGRFEEALAEAEEAVRLAPGLAIGLATRAHVKLGMGRIPEAQEDLRQAIRLSVDFGPAIRELVNSFQTVSERRQALVFVEKELVQQVISGEGLRAYRDAARLNLEPEALLTSLRVGLRERPDLAATWSVVVQELAEMLQLDEALTLATEASERFPLLEQTWSDLSLVQRLRMDVPGEQTALEQAMRVSPASSSAARLLAHFHERRGDIPRSKELLELACARSPLDAVSHGAVAVVLWRQGDQAGALERLRHALKVQPGYTWGWQMLGTWAAASGQPKLGEDLAKMLVLQRPGEISPLLILARILASTKRFNEALQTVNQAIKQFPRRAEPYEVQAEILAALGRPADANAACEPVVFGSQLPAALRACRARLEAQRGNLVSAIERMNEVLKENPGYGNGWHNLANWLWQRNQHEEALKAVTNLRRLDPLNPIPLGYRASMKLQQDDRAGAMEDLERALRYDPGYTWAAFTLFDLQLGKQDIRAARHTLELIQRYGAPEQAKACEVKFRAKFLEVSSSQRSAGQIQVHSARNEELDEALARLKELALASEGSGESFDIAIKALIAAGQTIRVEQLLTEAIKVPTCNAMVGEWWMRRRVAHHRWYCTRAVSRLWLRSAAARRAIATLIKEFGNYKQSVGRTVVLVYLVLSLAKLVERQARTLAVLWLAWRHRAWLRADNQGWASVGYALLSLRRFRSTVRWLRDWKGRTDLKMWMLFNLALALRGRRRASQMMEVLEFAVKLPERDHTFHQLRLFLAMELALNGHTQQALEHFRELQTAGWNHYMQFQHRLTHGLIAVQQASPAEKKKVFRSERNGLRALLAQYGWSRFRVDYRRSITRMAQDTGSRWILASSWLGL